MRSAKKRLLAFALCAMMFAVLPMSADAKSLDDALFDNAKEALTLMSYGEYEKALDKLDLREAPSESDFEDFVCFELDSALTQTVQTDVAVAFKKSKKFWVAVPVEEPSDRDVQTLLLSSSDGKRFDGYKAASWGDVIKMVKKDKNAVWNEAYDPGTLVVVPDQ